MSQQTRMNRLEREREREINIICTMQENGKYMYLKHEQQNCKKQQQKQYKKAPPPPYHL